MTDLFMKSFAVFSPCRTWRYRLARFWGPGKTLNVIALNPSTADEKENDPTVTRLIIRAQHLGFDGLVVANLFALRSTDPSSLYSHQDPIGPKNDDFILCQALECETVVCAWGNHGKLKQRGDAVKRMLRNAGIDLHAFKFTNAGEPSHPLYLSYKIAPKPWIDLEVT
jgi:hypothetical protein